MHHIPLIISLCSSLMTKGVEHINLPPPVDSNRVMCVEQVLEAAALCWCRDIKVTRKGKLMFLKCDLLKR